MIEPIRGKLAIRELEPEEMTSGGVILPDISQAGVSRGIIEAIGPSVYNYGTEMKSQCKIGDVIAYPKRAAYPIEIDDKEILVINESDLFCIIKTGEK